MRTPAAGSGYTGIAREGLRPWNTTSIGTSESDATDFAFLATSAAAALLYVFLRGNLGLHRSSNRTLR